MTYTSQRWLDGGQSTDRLADSGYVTLTSMEENLCFMVTIQSGDFKVCRTPVENAATQSSVVFNASSKVALRHRFNVGQQTPTDRPRGSTRTLGRDPMEVTSSGRSRVVGGGLPEQERYDRDRQLITTKKEKKKVKIRRANT